MATAVFMGTPEFALPALRALIARHKVVGVVTRPDRPAGRGRASRPSAVKLLALEHSLPLLQPRSLRSQEAYESLVRWHAEVYIVAAFGQILPQRVLDIPSRGALNIHASLLPRWRGAAPMQTAIRAGDPQTGVSLMLMEAGLDSGPVLAQRPIPLKSSETAQSLHDRLAPLGAELLMETLPAWLAGRIDAVAQDESQVTLAPMLRKEDGRIDWSQPAQAIERQIRAFTPWPGSFTTWDGNRLLVLEATIVAGSAAPGVVVANGTGIAIGTSAGLLQPLRLQLAGRSPQDCAAFLRGHRSILGARLGVLPQ